MTDAVLAQEPRALRVGRELDHARRHGPLREIVIPPCPELLTRLRQQLSAAEPDLAEVSRIAGSDVAMAATLIRSANSAQDTAGQPVQTVGHSMDRPRPSIARLAATRRRRCRGPGRGTAQALDAALA